MSVEDSNLLSYAADIPDWATFARFLVCLADDLRDRPQDWANTDPEDYLRMAAFWLVNGLDAFNRNMRRQDAPASPNWRLFADVLAAARTIEG